MSDYLDVAREYLRVSKDRSGRARSTSEQHDENEREAAACGWTLGEPYVDNDRSASRYATKARDQFLRLIEDLERDRFNASILILWESSRGSRKVGEWVEMIELCEKRGVRIHVTTHARTYNPANGRDRRSLLEDAVDSEYESSKVSERARRSHAAHAQAGLPTGRTPLGYRRRYDPLTRRLIAQVPDDSPEALADEQAAAEREGRPVRPAAAPMVRELFDRLSRGHTLRSIAKDFETRGFVNGAGNPFTQQHLRVMARAHCYVGLRVHVPGRKAGDNTNRTHAAASLTEAAWEPLVSPETFWAVQRVLDDPKRRTAPRHGRARHLLSMIARCGVCGDVLTVRFAKSESRQESYACRRGAHVRVLKAQLDDLAVDVMLAYLAHEDLAAAIETKETDNVALRAIRAEITALRRRLDEIVDEIAEGRLSPETGGRAEALVRKKLDEALDREREATTPPALRGLVEPGPGVAARWRDTPLEVQRKIARILLTPELIGELRIKRSAGLGKAGDPVHTRVAWRRVA